MPNCQYLHKPRRPATFTRKVMPILGFELDIDERIPVCDEHAEMAREHGREIGYDYDLRPTGAA